MSEHPWWLKHEGEQPMVDVLPGSHSEQLQIAYTEQLARANRLQAENERLREALRQIAAGLRGMDAA